MPRLDLSDSLPEMVTKLSEGNPGAVKVIWQLMGSSSKVDPQSGFGPLTPLQHLDSAEVYGSDIWLLFKNVCGEDVILTLAVLRCLQMGIISKGAVRESIKMMTDCGLELDTLVERLQEKLPEFKSSL